MKTTKAQHAASISEPKHRMRRFLLEQTSTGEVIAEGVQFSDGQMSIHWLEAAEFNSITSTRMLDP